MKNQLKLSNIYFKNGDLKKGWYMKLNIFYRNTLEIDLEKAFKIKKFDIVIGNPPYCNSFEKI